MSADHLTTDDVGLAVSVLEPIEPKGLEVL